MRNVGSKGNICDLNNPINRENIEMEFNTKEFSIKIGKGCVSRTQGSSRFNVSLYHMGEYMDITAEPKDLRDLFDALSVTITLADFSPEPVQTESIQSTSET